MDSKRLLRHLFSKEFNNALQLFNNKAYAAAEKSLQSSLKKHV